MQAPIMKPVFRIASLMLLLLAHGIGGASEEPPYPRKVVRVVVPYAPGGGADIMARAVGQRLTARFNQQFIVENRPGGGGRVAPAAVAKSTPDGYTLLLGTSSTHVFLPALDSRLEYDPIRHFSPIAPFAMAASVLLVHPSVPAKSVKDLIRIARSRSGQLNYSSTGMGTPGHLSAELFNYAASVKTTAIPYNGAGPGLIATMSGETDLIFSNILPAIPTIQSGRLRPLAVTSSKRSSALPDLPTVAESGLPDFEVTIFFGLFSPARTPANVVDTLFQEVSRVSSLKEFRERLAKDGAEPMEVAAPKEFTSLISKELGKWSAVLKHAKVKVQ